MKLIIWKNDVGDRVVYDGEEAVLKDSENKTAATIPVNEIEDAEEINDIVHALFDQVRTKG